MILLQFEASIFLTSILHSKYSIFLCLDSDTNVAIFFLSQNCMRKKTRIIQRILLILFGRDIVLLIPVYFYLNLFFHHLFTNYFDDVTVVSRTGGRQR